MLSARHALSSAAQLRGSLGVPREVVARSGTDISDVADDEALSPVVSVEVAVGLACCAGATNSS